MASLQPVVFGNLLSKKSALKGWQETWRLLKFCVFFFVATCCNFLKDFEIKLETVYS